YSLSCTTEKRPLWPPVRNVGLEVGLLLVGLRQSGHALKGLVTTTRFGTVSDVARTLRRCEQLRIRLLQVRDQRIKVGWRAVRPLDLRGIHELADYGRFNRTAFRRRLVKMDTQSFRREFVRQPFNLSLEVIAFLD